MLKRIKSSNGVFGVPEDGKVVPNLFENQYIMRIQILKELCKEVLDLMFPRLLPRSEVFGSNENELVGFIFLCKAVMNW